MHGVVPSQDQDLSLPIVDLHEIFRVLQPVEVSLNGSATTSCISCYSQFCIISKFAEEELVSITQVTNECIKQYWLQYQPLLASS